LEEQEGQQQQAEHVQYQLLPANLLSMGNIANMLNYSNPRPGPPEEFDFITNCITVLCNRKKFCEFSKLYNLYYNKAMSGGIVRSAIMQIWCSQFNLRKTIIT
jgi:hypothetical protein